MAPSIRRVDFGPQFPAAVTRVAAYARVSTGKDAMLHFLMIAEGGCHGIVDHHESRRRHKDSGSGHGNDRCRGSRDAVDLYRDVSLVVHEHGIDLACRDAVAARAVDPDDNIAVPGEKLIAEHLRCDVVVKPAFLRDGSVQLKDSFLCGIRVRLVDPVPELPVLRFHRIRLPPWS